MSEKNKFIKTVGTSYTYKTAPFPIEFSGCKFEEKNSNQFFVSDWSFLWLLRYMEYMEKHAKKDQAHQGNI
jgi:hypothetical protein